MNMDYMELKGVNIIWIERMMFKSNGSIKNFGATKLYLFDNFIIIIIIIDCIWVEIFVRK